MYLKRKGLTFSLYFLKKQKEKQDVMLSLSKHAGGPLHTCFDGAQHDIPHTYKEKAPEIRGFFFFIFRA
jgi:hypothetical protein